MSAMKSRLLLPVETPYVRRSEASASKPRALQESAPASSQDSAELKQVLLMFKQFMGSSHKIEAALSNHLKTSSCAEMEPRDRPVVIALPDQGRVLSKDGLQKYITRLCKEVWSRAFYYYSTNQLSYEHTKIYSSEQILQNLVKLFEKYPLEGRHFALINSHMEGKVLEYMLNKYPMTLSQQINRNVNNTIMEADNSEQLQNDYLYNSNILFKFREAGEYNDLIMKTINSVIMRIEHRVGNKTIFEKFEEKMEKLFEMVTDEDVMKDKDDSDDLDQYDSLWKISVAFQNQMQRKVTLDDNMKKEGLKKREIEREKYRNKVKEYTNYKIGRKLPESTRTFSNEEIISHNIKIESPQVLRLLTKWCEELEKKFSTPNYFEHYIETLKLENGKFIILMLNEMKESLDQLMVEEKAKIKSEIEELSLNNYFLQSELLMRELQNIGYNEIQKYERISAKYSIDIVNNLHSYIITYLNRLIHGLLTVAIKFSKLPSVSHIEWPSNINLITFQVMDLLRCKCSSGEKEILKIFKQLNTMCGENQNMKLVRVVNRLKRGTHDVLINVRYRDVLCEIQLAVTSKNNKFIEYSNTFNHYLYELKRSVFGPLTELCSIWKSLDLKFNVYADIGCEKCKEFPCKRPHQCSQKNEYEQYSKPFICSQCHVHNFHNNFIKQHLKCKHCLYWICARCQIEISDCKSMLSAAYKNEDIVRKCSRIRSKVNEIPDFGICIHIESPEIRVEPFRRYTHKNLIKIIGVKNKILYEIDDISTPHREAAFRERFLIFELTDDFGSRYIKIDDEKVKDFLLEQRIINSYSRNKEKICLNNRGLTDTLFEKFATLGTKTQRDNIKKIEIVSNRLENVKNIVDNFSNLNTLEMSKNIVTNFTGIQKLDKLQKLFISENNLQEIPKEISQLDNLKELTLCDNHITSIPDYTGKLQRLKQLKMSGNKIQLIPQSLTELKNLNELHLKNNLIKRIPCFIGNFINLQILQIQNNYISFVHENIGQLTKLQAINLSYNQISVLPSSFSALKGLTRCNLRHNGLKQAPQFNEMKALVTIDLSNNQISKLISIKSLPKLISLNANYNLLEQLPQISDCPGIRCLSAAHNFIKKLPDVQNLSTLQQLYLNNNQLDLLPDNMQKLQKLEMLHLEHNNIAAIQDLKLQKMKKLNISHNKLKSFSNMDFRMLEELDVSFNQIIVFSWNLLPLIRKLNINNNKIETLDLTSYPKLKCIFASSNKLQVLPEVSEKNSIKTLILEHNLIKTLPPNLNKFRLIQQMNLGHNHIRIIPRQIEQMVSLMDKSLQLNHNPVQNIESWEFVLRKITRSTIQQLELLKHISEQQSQLEVRSQESVDLSHKQAPGKASSVF